MKRFGKYLIIVERRPPMKVEARIYAGPGVEVEDQAVLQLKNAASLPGVVKVLATPDIHLGYGVPIGAVVAMDNAIIPAAVGYDINCGMRLMATPLDADQVPLIPVVREVHASIPLGEGKRNIRFSAGELRRVLSSGVPGLIEILADRSLELDHPELADGLDLEIEQATSERIEDCGSMRGNPDALPPRAIERGAGQLATLGGGNHFIELQKVTDLYDSKTAASWGIRKGQLTIMIHSGSRGLGHETGGHYMKLAHDYDQAMNIEHPGRDLAWLPLDSPGGEQYLGAMNAAANFAFVNRHLMAMLVRRALRNNTGAHAWSVYDVSHNMAKLERHGGQELVVHRKGATRAFTQDRMKGTQFEHTGQPVLIPGSMGTASYLLTGDAKSPEALYSVNHGAGRAMSRTAAAGKGGRRGNNPGLISDDEFRESMKGIILVAEDMRSAREEAPAAYKDIEAVIDTVTSAGLARKVARMVPLAVLKG
jgi:tRNA-splicing ligase RtcB